MNIVFLDSQSTNPGDLSWEPLSSLGNLMTYPHSSPEEAVLRMADADIVLFNEFHMSREIIAQAPRLKLLCIAATGYDNLDVSAAKERGIACTNIPAYSTEAVAQHTIALLLELTNRVGLHDESVRKHEWNRQTGACYFKTPLTLLDGKTLGIVGYGRIGKRVAAIGSALGMKIAVYSMDPRAAMAADVISLHLPVAKNTRHFINASRIHEMKDGVILLNAARGALIEEEDVANALQCGKIAGYAADVMTKEPPARDNPLIGLPNCIITPHHAWCPRETRQKLISLCAGNIKRWMKGDTQNRIDL